MKKLVDTTEYLDMLSELVKQGETVPVPVAGDSMRPFLRDKRDTAWLSPVYGGIKRGDILYRGRGVSTDIIESSILAYIEAINRALSDISGAINGR